MAGAVDDSTINIVVVIIIIIIMERASMRAFGKYRIKCYITAYAL